MVKFLLKLTLLLVLLLPLLVAGLLLGSLQQHSLVGPLPVLSHDDVRQVRDILRQHDPRQQQPGTEQRLAVTAQSLTLVGTHGLQTLTHGITATGLQASLAANRLQLQLSASVPDNPVGGFFNLAFSLSRHEGQLNISELAIGRWSIPDWLAAQLPALLHATLKDNSYWQLVEAAVLDYQFTAEALLIDYRWQTEWEQLARAKVRELTDHAGMQVYAREIDAMRYFDRLSMPKLLGRLFKLAALNSRDGDAVEENRALLQLLGQWALGKQTYGDTYLHYFAARLEGRVDLAQHLLVSAAIASHSNKQLSNLVGTGKEMSDSDGGSGFSFDDLAADRAGSLLGKLATRDQASARQVQKLLADPAYSSRLMPDIRALPPPMTKQQFIERYGTIGNPRYLEQVTIIDENINRLPFFQAMMR